MRQDRDHWGELRALNHTVLPPGCELKAQPIDGFDAVTIVRKGMLRITNGALPRQLTAGQVDVVSSGAGVELHRFNPGDCPAEFFEVRLGVAPRHRVGRVTDQIVAFPSAGQADQMALLASGFPEDRLAPPLRAGARVFGARLSVRSTLEHDLHGDRAAYAVAMHGSVAVNGFVLDARDGAAIRGEPRIVIEALTPAEIILIETV